MGEAHTLIPRDQATGANDSESRRRVTRWRSARETILQALRSAPAVAQAIASMDQAPQFHIEWPPGALDAVRSGSAKWTQYADGTRSVVIRDPANNAILKHLKLSDVGAAPELLACLNNLAVQSALASIAVRLEEIDQKLDRVLAGAAADRRGRVQAGLRLYEQALAVRDADTRRGLLQHAAAVLTEGRHQLLEFLASEAASLEVPTLLGTFFKSTPFRATPAERLAQRLDEVQIAAGWSLRATRGLVAVYEELVEPRAASVAMQQLVDGLEPVLPKFRSLARSTSSSNGAQPDVFWNEIDKRILPAARTSVDRLLSVSADGSLVIEVERTELQLEEGT